MTTPALFASQDLLVAKLREAFPQLMAVYAFGSRVRGDATLQSDWDLAVLLPGKASPLVLWELSGPLSDLVQAPVDLLDFRAASTVMQHQILTTGERWWAAKPAEVGGYEAGILSDKTSLDEARAGLLADIQASGRIYGR